MTTPLEVPAAVLEAGFGVELLGVLIGNADKEGGTYRNGRISASREEHVKFRMVNGKWIRWALRASGEWRAW
jgi:hypothetical protein